IFHFMQTISQIYSFLVFQLFISILSFSLLFIRYFIHILAFPNKDNEVIFLDKGSWIWVYKSFAIPFKSNYVQIVFLSKIKLHKIFTNPSLVDPDFCKGKFTRKFYKL